MIVKVAWRNIWRNKVRSLVVIIAIALGLWAGVFASGFVVGMMEQKIDSIIMSEMSHFQVHHPEFREEFKAEYTIENHNEVLERLQQQDSVIGISSRVISLSMMGSANKNGAINIRGIDPIDESKVTNIHEQVIEGAYFEGVKRNPILISQKVAELYKVKLRSKVVLTMQDINGEITSAAFRVVGIYNTDNALYDKMNAFVTKEDLQKLLSIDSRIHEIAVLLSHHAIAESVSLKYQKLFPQLEIKSWKDLAAGMRVMVEAKDIYTVIIVSIILMALLFSIINTMLMAVLERVREIGMLMAVGMSKGKVFKMIMYETIFLSIIGGPLGLLIAWISIYYFGNVGIDLGGAAYGDVGFASVVYPELDAFSYFKVSTMVIFMAIIAAIYPARKALRLNPVEAIRKI